jgi:hypothetical protein
VVLPGFESLGVPTRGAKEWCARHTFDVSGCGADATYTCIGNRGYGDWSCVREQ